MRAKSAISICLLAALLSGCGVGEEPGSGPGPDAGPEEGPIIQGSEDPPPAGDTYAEPEPPAPGLTALGCSGENGYYLITATSGPLADGRQARHLMYIDYGARREVYLCSDPACSHDTADCTSVLLWEDFSRPSLFVMGGRVYILSGGPDMDGAVSMGAATAESVPAVLYAMEADGTGRERVYDFEEGLTLEDFAAGDGEGIYFITKRVSTEAGGGNTYFTSTDRRLVRLDPETGELSTVCQMDFGDGIDWKPAGCSGREIVLSGIDFGGEVKGRDREDRTIYDDADDVFAALDVDTGELREFYRVGHPKSRSWVLDGANLYYALDGAGRISRVSISSGEERVLCETPHDMIYGILGGRLYTWDGGEGAYYFIDTSSGEMSRCGLVKKTVGTHIDILAEAGDMVLVIYDCDAVFHSDGSFSTSRLYYGMISKLDLYDGVENYLPIETPEAEA